MSALRNGQSSLSALRSALLALQLLALASLSASWPDYLHNGLGCQTMHVTHLHNGLKVTAMNNTDNDIYASIVLLKNGAEVNCFEPGQNYEVELKSHYKQMKGLLWMLDPARGDFPLGQIPRNTKINTPCPSITPHLSHFCPSQAGCTIGDNGLSVKVGYRAPSDETSVVTFRYTVVFQVHEFLQNERQTFERCTASTTQEPIETTEELPPCPSEDSANQTPEAHDNNLTNLDVENNLTFENTVTENECNTFEAKPGAVESNGNCGIIRDRSNESRPYTDPSTNVDYICVIMDPVKYTKKVVCEPQCDKNGEPTICRIKTRRERTRRFICTPTGEYAEFGNVYRDFTVENQLMCECYSVADVDMKCSQPTTTEKPVRCRTSTTTTSPVPTDLSNRP